MPFRSLLYRPETVQQLAERRRREFERRRGSARQRGYGSAWQKVRAAHLAEHPLCVFCAREGRVTVATVVDHVVPHHGDHELFWNPDNFQSLCKHHHDCTKQREEKSDREGRGESKVRDPNGGTGGAGKMARPRNSTRGSSHD